MNAIYLIENTENGHEYIGSSIRPRQRWAIHRAELRGGYHPNGHLQRAWIKYGERAFRFSVMEVVSNAQDLLSREQWWLDLLAPAHNIALTAGAPMMGRRHSEKTKRMLSELRRGRKHTPEELAKMSAAQRGRTHSTETRKKLAEIARARADIRLPKSPETRAKMSIARSAWWSRKRGET